MSNEDDEDFDIDLSNILPIFLPEGKNGVEDDGEALFDYDKPVKGIDPLSMDQFTGFKEDIYRKGSVLLLLGYREDKVMADSVPMLFDDDEDASAWLEENAGEYNNLSENMSSQGFDNLIVVNVTATIH